MKHDAPLGSGNLYQVQLQWRGSDPIVGIARSQSGSRLVGRRRSEPIISGEEV